MIKPLYNYDGSLSLAKNYYRATANGNYDEAKNSLDKFFEYSKRINPCVARMSIQQAQNDVFLEQYSHYMEDIITADEVNHRQNLLKLGMLELNHDERLSELEKRIKELYKKSAKKRLAVIPCILDGEVNGLALVKPKTVLGKLVSNSDDIIENKRMKKIFYIMRRLFTRK